MSQFKPIRPSRVSDEVVKQLRDGILSGRLKAGERLPSERDLAQDFEVSRVAVREALRKLENSGFICVRHGATGGAFVQELTFDHLTMSFVDLFLAERISIEDLYQVRLLIEPEIARLAAQHITPEDAGRLLTALEEEERQSQSMEDDIQRKTTVHFILAEICRNKFFEVLVRALMEVTRRVVLAGSPDFNFIHPAGMHRPVVEAVLAGDAQGAAEAMRLHAIEFGKTLIQREKTFREKQSLSSS